VIIKSYITEQNPGTLNNYRAFLFYGENDGIKNDFKLKIKSTNQNSEIINFFENEIIKNKNILYENVVNESLFNEKKIIFIHAATDKILNEICESLEKKNQSIKIYIFSNNLEKKSKLRIFFEKEKNLATCPCYQDNERTLNNYISNEFKGFKGLTGELINLIIENSSLNRKIIQSEIIKIKSFFNEKIINKNNLLEILNIKYNAGFEEIRDKALTGKKNKVNKLLSEIEILNEECFLYLNILNFRILKLIEIQKINVTFHNHEKSIESLRPPIFWKDKPIYIEQLKKWNLEKLDKAAAMIGEAEALMKINSQIRNDVIIKNLVIFLSKEAFISL